MNGISALIKEAPEKSLASLAIGEHNKKLSMNQEVGPHQTLSLLEP